jgi:transporter family-2 protein
MIWLSLLAALLLGGALSVQVGINAQLRTAIGHPVVAAAASFVVGTIGLLLVIAAVRPGLPSWTQLTRVPWWQWTGGLLGALYVAAAIVLAPRLGAAALLATIVAGQMLASLILDHFGLFGFPVQSVSALRVLAVTLIIGGVLLLQVARA